MSPQASTTDQPKMQFQKQRAQFCKLLLRALLKSPGTFISASKKWLSGPLSKLDYVSLFYSFNENKAALVSAAMSLVEAKEAVTGKAEKYEDVIKETLMGAEFFQELLSLENAELEGFFLNLVPHLDANYKNFLNSKPVVTKLADELKLISPEKSKEHAISHAGSLANKTFELLKNMLTSPSPLSVFVKASAEKKCQALVDHSLTSSSSEEPSQLVPDDSSTASTSRSFVSESTSQYSAQAGEALEVMYGNFMAKQLASLLRTPQVAQALQAISAEELAFLCAEGTAVGEMVQPIVGVSGQDYVDLLKGCKPLLDVVLVNQHGFYQLMQLMADKERTRVGFSKELEQVQASLFTQVNGREQLLRLLALGNEASDRVTQNPAKNEKTEDALLLQQLIAVLSNPEINQVLQALPANILVSLCKTPPVATALRDTNFKPERFHENADVLKSLVNGILSHAQGSKLTQLGMAVANVAHEDTKANATETQQAVADTALLRQLYVLLSNDSIKNQIPQLSQKQFVEIASTLSISHRLSDGLALNRFYTRDLLRFAKPLIDSLLECSGQVEQLLQATEAAAKAKLNSKSTESSSGTYDLIVLNELLGLITQDNVRQALIEIPVKQLSFHAQRVLAGKFPVLMEGVDKKHLEPLLSKAIPLADALLRDGASLSCCLMAFFRYQSKCAVHEHVAAKTKSQPRYVASYSLLEKAVQALTSDETLSAIKAITAEDIVLLLNDNSALTKWVLRQSGLSMTELEVLIQRVKGTLDEVLDDRVQLSELISAYADYERFIIEQQQSLINDEVEQEIRLKNVVLQGLLLLFNNKTAWQAQEEAVLKQLCLHMISKDLSNKQDKALAKDFVDELFPIVMNFAKKLNDVSAKRAEQLFDEFLADQTFRVVWSILVLWVKHSVLTFGDIWALFKAFIYNKADFETLKEKIKSKTQETEVEENKIGGDKECLLFSQRRPADEVLITARDDEIEPHLATQSLFSPQA